MNYEVLRRMLMKYMLMIHDESREGTPRLPGENRLRPSEEAVTIRLRDGRQSLSEGPFTGGQALRRIALIEAASKEEAVEKAKQLALEEPGAVEVRPARNGACWPRPVRGAQQFMVMFIADADRPFSREEVFAGIESHYEHCFELAARGQYVSSRALQPADTATTVRWKNGKPLVTDGPFAETKEFIAGYFVIACDTLDEAVEWARKLMFPNPACEVRPLEAR